MIDKKELTKIPPQERIKKLKLMEDERKKEVDEIESLIKESIKEIKTDKLAEEIAPEQRVVDISRLFEMTGEQALERAARKGRAASLRGVRYPAFLRPYEDYSQLKKLYSILSIGGSLTEDQLSLVGKIGERINKFQKYIPEGEKYVSILDASKAVLKKLKSETGIE